MAALESFVRDFMEWKSALLALLTLIIAWLSCKFLYLDAFMSPLRNLPGPPTSMFLGNMLELKRRDSFEATSEWSKKYGGIFVMWLRPDRPVVYLTEIELVKQVLVTNCYKYWRPSLVRLVIPSLGNSLLTSNGKNHAWQRKMINPAFSYTNLKGMVPSMKSSADDLVQVIKERHRMREMGRQAARRDLLDIAMDMVDEQTGARMDDDQLRALVFTFLFAGHETTGVSMSWTLYELAKCPKIQEKIRKEANEVLGDGTDITWAKLEELQCLSNVIKESMRLHPVVAQVGRESAQDDTLGGYHIPTNTHFLIGIHVIHRSEKYWPDPYTFKPERFENLTKEQESLVRYLLMPFSFGPRMCIGNRLAMAEMRLVLAYLLQKFIFSPVPGFPEVKPKMSLTAKPFPSLQLRVRAVETDA